MSARGTSPPYSLGRIFGFTASFRSSILACSCNMRVGIIIYKCVVTFLYAGIKLRLSSDLVH
jgi:hypothetical protein